MKYLLHASLTLLAITAQCSAINPNQKTKLKEIERLCESWHSQSANNALIKQIIASEGNLEHIVKPSDINPLLELIADIERLEVELIISGLSQVETRLKSLRAFCSTLLNHLPKEYRLILDLALELDNQEISKQLENAVSILEKSSKENKSFDISTQPDAQYLLFVYSLRKQLLLQKEI